VSSNLIAQRSLIPAVRHTFAMAGDYSMTCTIVTGVFAVEAFAQKNPAEIWRLWQDKPRGRISGEHIDFDTS
jgi:hypothetical protein